MVLFWQNHVRAIWEFVAGDERLFIVAVMHSVFSF